MNKTAIAIIAHPDDEAAPFGGTLIKLAEDYDTYIICATKGDAGQNDQDDKSKSLSDVRVEELRSSAKILGVKEVFFLDFKDGDLSNNLYHEIAQQIQKITDQLQPEILITLEPKGITGHIDHIVISLVTTYIFYRTSYPKKLLYSCFSQEVRKLRDEILDDYIYFPPGYHSHEIGLTIDVTSNWDKKINAIKSHKSQQNDPDNILYFSGKVPKEEYFLELIKDNT